MSLSPLPGLYVLGCGNRGRGVFTRVPVARATVVLSFGGEALARHDVADFSRCLQVGADRWLGPSGGMDDLVNHSCDPNCGLYLREGSVQLVAIRDLEADEELTFDYSTSMRDEPWSMECECGAIRCRGVIEEFARLPGEVQRRYAELGAVLPHVVGSPPPALSRSA